MKLYHIAITLLGVLFFGTANASNENLPYCAESICEKVFHNKKTETATLIVWSGNADIIHSFSFDLDKTAKLSSKRSSKNTGDGFTTYDTEPPVSCSGTCSVPVSQTYTTATEIITITTTFIYVDGQLVDVKSEEVSRIPRPDNQIEK